MNRERYVMAVDGGATKTILEVYSGDGLKLFEKTSTGSNFHAIGTEKVENVITELLLAAHHDLNFSQIEIAGFAMAGIDTGYDLSVVNKIIINCFNRLPFVVEKIIVENDVLSALIGITGGKPGALLLSGTGSIAYALDAQGKTVRAGGWGHRAADEGSGYWIGQQIVRAVVRQEDGQSCKQTLLKQLLYEKLNLNQLDELLSWLYAPNYTNAQVASVSSLLIDAVKHDDEVAIEIAKNAAHELTILVKTVLRKINYVSEPFTLYLNGGVLQNHSMIRDLLIHNLVEDYPNLSFELCKSQPIQYVTNRVFAELKKGL